MHQLNNNSKILVVDDFDSARQLILRSLTALGFQNLHEALDGLDAFKKVEAAAAEGKPYEFIFSDINMPYVDGMELLSRCKKNEVHKNIPIIMVTAESEIHMVTKALKDGAFDYIKKPISVSALKAKVVAISERLKKEAA